MRGDVLITGATGTLGHRVVGEATEAGHKVRGRAESLASATPASTGRKVTSSAATASTSGDGIDAAPFTPWTDFFAAVAPWEKVFDPADDGNGPWEQGVTAVNGGAWEKVFGEAPSRTT
jgi:nucleoside-diphosphate-sugar epimerase